MRKRHATTAILLAVAGAASGHSDQVDRAAWTACEGAVLADACEYVDHHEFVYRGSCRLMSDALLCVRSEPIERPEAAAAQ